MKKILISIIVSFLLASVAYSQCEPIATFPRSEGLDDISIRCDGDNDGFINAFEADSVVWSYLFYIVVITLQIHFLKRFCTAIP